MTLFQETVTKLLNYKIRHKATHNDTFSPYSAGYQFVIDFAKQ